MAAIYFFFRILNTKITFPLSGSRSRFDDGVPAVEASLGQAAAPIRRYGSARCWSLRGWLTILKRTMRIAISRSSPLMEMCSTTMAF